MEKDTIFKGKIKQSGIFNFKDLYQFLYEYLIDENYDVFEDKYIEKIEGEAKNVEIKWTALKSISDYFRFEIQAYWLILGMKKIKVKKEGREVTMDSGSIEIRFHAVLQKDYENRWENRPFFKFLRGIYDRYIIRTRVDDYELKLFEEINDIIAQTKSFLTIEGQRGAI